MVMVVMVGSILDVNQLGWRSLFLSTPEPLSCVWDRRE
jgi:hypothetical protein